MSGQKSEQESFQVAEAARQKEWEQPSFMRELFLGNFRLDLIHPFPDTRQRRPEFAEFYDKMKAFLKEEVNPVEIDRTGEYPPHVVDGLRKLGAFGMKVPKAYGGLGLNQLEYNQTMELIGSYDGNLTALLSAHQSIGVPQPLKLFGTPEQKKKYLPRCAAGAISAFALTEPHVGSDPARLASSYRQDVSGDYILNGEKLWCTNGTLADLLVVMARDPKTKAISTFIVETAWEGVKVEHRCHFMGLKALANGVVSFKEVRVPKENLIGKEGRGLKIALVTLNTGRLTLPAAVTGMAKQCLEIVRRWANARVQWGAPIGKHEAVAHMISDIAATTFAMESVSDLAGSMADRGGYDIRLEAAAAKEWNTVQAWRIIDATLQVRGGRGYETESSLAARGEAAIGVERMMRDSRINLIFEGSSEIMHLFMAREAVDKHLQVAGVFADPGADLRAKLRVLPQLASFYGRWYPTRYVSQRTPQYDDFGPLAGHLAFVEATCRKLARHIFHGMVRYRAELQRKQAFLFRVVDIGNELFAMAASLCRAQRMQSRHEPHAKEAARLADLFCRGARRRIRNWFVALWQNDDELKTAVAQEVLGGRHTWLEEGIMGLPYSDQEIAPQFLQEQIPAAMQLLAREAKKEQVTSA